MASQKEKLDILRRYYSEPTAQRIRNGWIAAASGHMGSLNNLDCDHRPSMSTRGARDNHRAKALMRKLTAMRRAGEAKPYLSDADYSAILGHVRLHRHTPAHRLVTFWNRRVGREVLAKRTGPNPSNHIGLVEGPLATFSKAWSMSRTLAPEERWVATDDAQVIYRRDGSPVRFDGYAQYSTDSSSRVRLLAGSENSCFRLMINIDTVMAEALGLRVVSLADWVGDELAARAHEVATWNDTSNLSGTASKLFGFWPDSTEDANTYLAATYAELLTGSERCQIHGYHTSAQVLVGEAPVQAERLTLGIEWEVGARPSSEAAAYIQSRPALSNFDNYNDRAVSAQQTVSAFRKAAGRASYVHAEADSSVDHGYELVFAYRTLERHRELFAAALTIDDVSPWQSTIRTSPSCGIHVHVGRAVGTDHELTPQQITGVANLVHASSNREYIEGMARRSISNNSHLSLPPGEDGRVGISDGGLNAALKRHYSVVNARKETIEFRMFATTVDANQVLEAVEIAESMTEYARMISVIGPRYFYLDVASTSWKGYAAYLRANAGRWPLAAGRSAQTVQHLEKLAACEQRRDAERLAAVEAYRAREAEREAAEAEEARLRGEEADALLRDLLGDSTDPDNPRPSARHPVFEMETAIHITTEDI